ncbi:MAG: anaerobic sulfatase maturase [Deltaproteobacteria bacterium]|nr:anaerobic sulfatase maturase [Deltaproteobacteria bacterium]
MITDSAKPSLNASPSSSLPPAFHIMTKPRGAICNLDCKYCYFLKKEAIYPRSDFRMSEEILETYTRQYIETQRVPEVTFAWQGGEPTLTGLEFYQRAVAFQKKYRKPGMRIHNALQTNGTILDDEWCRFFKQNNFLIGLSLDGPSEIHNAYRVDKGGKPTFDKVMVGLALLIKHQVAFNILTTVHAANVDHPLEVYRFLRDEVETQFIQFIPIVERKNQSGFQEGYQVTTRSVTGKKYGRFLTAVFNEWVRKDVGQVFVQIFDVALGVWYGQPATLCVFGEICGTALALEHNGDLYSCDHFVEPDHLLGNIHGRDLLEMVGHQKHIRFGFDKRDTLPRYCQKCDVRFICNGGCPKNRIRRTPNGEEGLNFLCDGYKAFFTHIDEPMKLMVKLLHKGRPPADVMLMVGKEEA